MKDYARKLLTTLFVFFFSLSGWAQYSDYVGGDWIKLPSPTAPISGATIYSYIWDSPSPCLEVRNNWVKIAKYFEGTINVQCTYYYTYTRYGSSYETHASGVAYYTISCREVRLLGIPTSLTMEKGEKKKIGWYHTPSTAFRPDVDWESSNYNVVSVGIDGELTAKRPGTATITAINSAGSDVSFPVTVTGNPQLDLSASPKSGSIMQGNTVQLSTSDMGKTVTDADIYYTLDGSTPSKSSTIYTSSGVSINEDCTLKAIAYKDGYDPSDVLTEKYSVIIPVKPESVSVDIDAKSIGVGGMANAKYTIVPANANINTEVTWSSDDEGVVTINQSGKITGVKEGMTFVRAKTKNGKTGICKIMVRGASVFDDGIGVATFATSGRHTFIVKKDGSLWACGQNDTGELCDGTKNSTVTPKFIMNNVASVSVGTQLSSNNSFILKRDGTLWACGEGSDGVLGTGSTQDVFVPTKIMDNVVKVRTTGYQTHILKNDGTLWACGWNNGYELGIGSSNENAIRSTPVKILDDVLDITPGSHVLAIKKDNTLWAWGDNQYGVLGDGTTNPRYAPVKVMENVVTASTNFAVMCAVKKDGTLWSCGGNVYHNLCDGTQNSKTFKQVMDSVYSVFNFQMYFIIKQDGSLWGYGDNDYGQLGIGTKTYKEYYPVKIMEDVDSIDSGWSSCLVRKKDGSLWAFGSNSRGQLCDGTTEAHLTPIKVMNAPDGKPYEIAVQLSDCSIERGKTKVIECKVKPYNPTSKVIWSSDDPTIATVDSLGTVKGIRPGTTYINAETENGKIDWCKVTVYVETVEKTVKTSSDGYATFFDSESAYSLPTGLSAQIVTGAANGKLTYKTIATGSADGYVPANTAVMLTNERKMAESFTLKSLWSEDQLSDRNLLHGSDEATTTTGDGYHYKLCYGQSGTNMKDVFGWYWGAADGNAFQIDGHKAWLVVPKTSSGGTRGYTIEGEATGIDVINTDNEGVYHDLQGRRISKPVKKGIYIRNGKIVINH